MPSLPFRCWRQVELLTAADWRRQSCSAPTACCSEPGSWPAGSPRSSPISSRRSWKAMGTTRCSPKYRISRLGWSGPGRCHARGATGSSNDGQDVNGRYANAKRRQRQHCKPRKDGDTDEAVLSMGQDAGLIHDIAPAAEIVSRIAEEAERILTGRVARFIRVLPQ